VRFRDLLIMALSALLRHKVRTVLTTLGVVFGSVVLVASLSVRGGVHDTVAREAQRFGELRRIQVHPRYVGLASSVPAGVTEIRGQMSEARRQRLREQAIQRWRQQQPARRATKLDPRALEALAKIPSVRKVEPALPDRCRVRFGGKLEPADCMGAFPEDANYRDRISVGSFLPAAEARCVVVSEDLLYRLGVAADDALAAVVGQKLRLEIGGTQQDPEATAAVVKEELTICGVLRLAAQHKDGRRWDEPPLNPDLILPTRTAEAIFWRLPQMRAHGFNAATVEVERLEDVKPVSKVIMDRLGFNAGSRAFFVEREQFTYRLIFTAMTVVALVALLVAALGIMNTMLMSVLERVREIGVMKAVGARDGHVQLMFLMEGAVVGLVGGLLGLLLSWGASFPGDTWVRSTVESGLSIKLQESIFLFPWWLVVGVPAFTCLVTTLAAYYPARRAARINPVQALRHE
jgi:putative ABC transport system permease protein